MIVRLKRTLEALSQLLNVVLFGGRPDEMLSAKMHRKRAAGCRVCRVACRLLDWLTWERDHCESAYQGDLRRARERWLEVYGEHWRIVDGGVKL